MTKLTGGFEIFSLLGSPLPSEFQKNIIHTPVLQGSTKFVCSDGENFLGTPHSV
jgi:hypothetical protein